MSGSTEDQVAGPSSPRILSAPSPDTDVRESSTDTDVNSTDTDPNPADPSVPLSAVTSADPSTPAPTVRAPPPSAPSPKIPPKDLPTQTPASSSTPTTRGPDISEFDPFAPVSATPATPAPKVAGPSKQAERVRVTAVSDSPATPSRTDGRRNRERQESSDGEPQFNFSGFLKDLRLKSAEPVARYLKSFLANFAKKPFTVNEQIKLIHDFLNFIAGKMTLCEPWKSQTPAEFDNAMEAMEKLVMNRLYNYTFTPQLVPSQPITTDDLERDAVFSQRVRLFGWIREQHLDVPEGEASQGFLGFAEQELLKINHYKAPRDKMICVLNCCKVIFGLIRHSNGAESTSADAFVPILIFVVLRANPENMLSNVEYINRFRSASKLSGEAGYYLSSLSGAIAFIESMDASSLSNISQEEFEQHVEQAIQDLPPSPSSSMKRSLPPTEMSPFAPSMPGEEAARPLSLNTSFAALDNTKKFFQRTGSTVSEAVSKPLNAITKIFDGMQQDEEGSTSGRSVDSNDGEGVETRWRAGGERDRESEHRQFGNNLHTPIRAGSRAHTPDSPTRRFAQMGLSPESLPPSRTGTPMRDGPMQDFSSDEIQSTIDMSQEAYAQSRRANVQTLHQMFPDLDEEVVEAVLEVSGDDLGQAIDRLLEM